MRLYETLLKHRSLVIALAVVILLGAGLALHLKSPMKKKPPRPSPAPSAAVQVEINPPSKPAVVSPPHNRLPNRNRVSPRPQAVRSVNTRVEPAQVSTGGKMVPVIIERSRSAVVITQAPKAQQASDNGDPS